MFCTAPATPHSRCPAGLWTKQRTTVLSQLRQSILSKARLRWRTDAPGEGPTDPASELPLQVTQQVTEVKGKKWSVFPGSAPRSPPGSSSPGWGRVSTVWSMPQVLPHGVLPAPPSPGWGRRVSTVLSVPQALPHGVPPAPPLLAGGG